MSAARIVEVDELDFALEPRAWDFSRERADDIRAYWEQRRLRQPSLFNGRVLLLGRHEFAKRLDGGAALRGAFFEVDFAEFLAWRDFGYPGGAVCNGFSMAALQGSDGAFLLGEMNAHTANAGKIYFAAGTPDLSDVFGARVDLGASVMRELEEETGVAASETSFDPGWIVVNAPPRVACMKIMRLAIPAEAAKARIEAFLARETQPELARIHVVRELADLDPARSLEFVRDFLRYAFAQRSVG